MNGVQFPANMPILRCDISTLQCILVASSGLKCPGCEADHSARSENTHKKAITGSPVLVSQHIMKPYG